MAPVEKRTIETEEDESKRQKLEEEEDEVDEEEEDEEEEDFNEDDSECDDDEEEDEDDVPTFRKEDFEGIEMTDDMLDKFCEAYNAFIIALHEKGDSEGVEPMLLTKPQTIRPVPQTKEDFDSKMMVALLSTSTADDKTRIAQELTDSNDVQLEDEDDLTDEKITGMLKHAAGKAIEVMNSEMDMLDKLVADSKLQRAFEQGLILTDMIFDGDLHHVFSEATDEEAAMKMLNRLAAFWTSILKQDDDVLGCKGIRSGVVEFINSCAEDLKKGDFVDEPDQNPFKDIDFKVEA